MRSKNWEQSEFTKVVRLTEQDYDWIKAVKGKKSAAGFLKEIINIYKNDKRKPIIKAS